MTSVAQPVPQARGAAARAAAALRTEVGIARIAFGAIGLYVVDDNFLQPEPGISPADRLVSGFVPLGLVVVAAAAYARARAGFRAVLALLFGFFGLLGGSEAAYYAQDVGLSGDDYTGLLSIAAGVVLIALGIRTLWRSRRRDDRLAWQYGRRALLAFAALLFAGSSCFRSRLRTSSRTSLPRVCRRRISEPRTKRSSSKRVAVSCSRAGTCRRAIVRR